MEACSTPWSLIVHYEVNNQRLVTLSFSLRIIIGFPQNTYKYKNIDFVKFYCDFHNYPDIQISTCKINDDLASSIKNNQSVILTFLTGSSEKKNSNGQLPSLRNYENLSKVMNNNYESSDRFEKQNLLYSFQLL